MSFSANDDNNEEDEKVVILKQNIDGDVVGLSEIVGGGGQAQIYKRCLGFQHFLQ